MKIKPVLENLDTARIDEIVQAGIESEIMAKKLQIMDCKISILHIQSELSAYSKIIGMLHYITS